MNSHNLLWLALPCGCRGANGEPPANFSVALLSNNRAILAEAYRSNSIDSCSLLEEMTFIRVSGPAQMLSTP